MKVVCWAGLSVALLLCSGCVYPMANSPHGARTTGSIYADFKMGLSMEVSEPPKWTPIGRATGETTLYSVLGMVCWGDGSFAAAYGDALRNTGADALVDFQADVNVFHILGIYVRSTTKVTGLAVKEVKGGSN